MGGFGNPHLGANVFERDALPCGKPFDLGGINTADHGLPADRPGRDRRSDDAGIGERLQVDANINVARSDEGLGRGDRAGEGTEQEQRRVAAGAATTASGDQWVHV
jgi:hypothetical protein